MRALVFYPSLATGADNLVGDEGKRLSFEQSQFISKVRAVPVNPDILVLDEAAASIHSQTRSLKPCLPEK
jgi:ABC-type multidrug transport system fused ATPase/permease subunit